MVVERAQYNKALALSQSIDYGHLFTLQSLLLLSREQRK